MKKIEEKNGRVYINCEGCNHAVSFEKATKQWVHRNRLKKMLGRMQRICKCSEREDTSGFGDLSLIEEECEAYANSKGQKRKFAPIQLMGLKYEKYKGMNELCRRAIQWTMTKTTISDKFVNLILSVWIYICEHGSSQSEVIDFLSIIKTYNEEDFPSINIPAFV